MNYRIKRNQRTNLKSDTLDALMRLQLNTPDVRLWDANRYTEKYQRRDQHFLCDDSMQRGGRKKAESEENDLEISSYSTIF